MNYFLIMEMILAIVVVVYLALVFKREMQMMQQNSYRNERYGRWLEMNNEYSSISRITDMALAVLLLSTFGRLGFVPVIVGIVLVVKIVSELKKKYKKPVVFTRRVWRLYAVTWTVVLLIIVAVYLLSGRNLLYVSVGGLAAAIFSYGVTMAANRMLKPVEAAINRRYYNDAKRLLSLMPDMKVVGITGSYGKTSTKHYLYRILSEKYDVLMTPGSYNTPMGVVRTIREMMRPYNDLFIVEMGAKQPGDIKEICDLVHPEIGIITAVGEQHLESFKSIENVQRTKFELVDSLPAGGLAVVNNDFPYIANRAVNNVTVKRYGVSDYKNTDYRAENVEYSDRGTRFTVAGSDGSRLELTTKLVGECNISNIMAAVIVALYLKVPQDKIKYAVSKIEQVEHRLNLKRTPAGITIIDDAFNSNPDGSRIALDVLSRMKGGKRIVITPGMIELGEKQAAYNRKFGEYIAKSCDVAIIVGRYNREAIMSGIASGGMPESNVYAADTFTEAQSLLQGIAVSGDTVLYENDLPDTFK